MFPTKLKIVNGYRPLNQQMFDRKDSEIKRRLPIRIRMRLKSRDIQALLVWLRERKLEFDFQSFESYIYFYLADNQSAMMMKLTWQEA